MQPAPPDPELLRRIPLTAHTILHVGCGHGALLAAYRPMNPTAHLLGIEANPAAAAAAAAHLHHVAAADVEHQPLPFDTPQGLDCIIYTGVLERLRDPCALLHRHAGALSPDGGMLIRVANPAHWRMAQALLTGRRDPPHAIPPPWITPDTMRQALLDAGLALCDETACEAPETAEAGRRFVAALAPALAALDIDPDDYARRALATHLVWRVRRQAQPRLLLSGSMLAPVGGVSHVRVVQPLEAMATDPTVRVAVTGNAIPPPPDGAARILVLHRPAMTHGEGTAMLRGLIQSGHVIVTEFDDHPAGFQMMRQGGDMAFRGVHAVQTSTPALAEVLRRYNPEIAVFPNAVAELRPVRNFANPEVVTCFFGALNRERDWHALLPAINAAAAKAGDRLRFRIVHDRQFFDALDSPHKHFTPTCDYPTYLNLLGDSEISLMPLADTPFNRAKSDLKFIEAGACRVAALASPVVYGDSIEDGRTGLLFRDPAELYSRLLRLVAMPGMARGLGDAARQYVTDHRMLAYQVAPRIAWYRSLWRRRDALTARLRDRMADSARPAA